MLQRFVSRTGNLDNGLKIGWGASSVPPRGKCMGCAGLGKTSIWALRSLASYSKKAKTYNMHTMSATEQFVNLLPSPEIGGNTP